MELSCIGFVVPKLSMFSTIAEHVLSIVLAILGNCIVLLIMIAVYDSEDEQADDQTGQDELCRDGKFICFAFPEKNPVIWDGNETFDHKTAYIRARQEIRKHFDARLPPEIAKYTPVFLYFLGRHSIRYPMDQELSTFLSELPKLKEKMLSSGKLAPTVAEELKNWQLLMHPSEAARITTSGKHETAIIARNFYSLFPRCLNIKTTAFEVGYTSKVRTKETAEAFVRSLVETQIRSDDISFDESNAQVDEYIKCKFPMKLNDDILLAHQANKKKEHKADKEELVKSEVIKAMICQFCERNGLDPSMVSIETIKVLYRIASYEMAHQRHSPFARLFTKSELQIIEYLSDLSAYNVAYTADSNKVGAIVMADLCRKLDEVLKSPPPSGHTIATLNFSHDGLFKRLLGFLGLFSHFPAYQLHQNRLYIPTERQWRSSYLIPFGTNICFVLFLDPSNSKYKLLSLFNEIPVTIAGMRSALGDLEDFLAFYKNADSK